MTMSVSYVWMRKDPQEAHTIPSHLFCRVQENAKRYPAAHFNLWVESSEAGEPYAIPSNVTLQSLSSLPTFSQIPVLSSLEPYDIWAKVDVARLLVLQHELHAMKHDVAIYSDMDVKDVLIESTPFTERIKKYGMAVGSVIDSLGNISRSAENGYFAFSTRRKNFLDALVEAVAEKANKPKHRSRNAIYNATLRFFDSRVGVRSLLKASESIPNHWRHKIAGFGVLPPCYYTGDQHLIAEAVRPKNSEKAVESQKLAA